MLRTSCNVSSKRSQFASGGDAGGWRSCRQNIFNPRFEIRPPFFESPLKLGNVEGLFCIRVDRFYKFVDVILRKLL